MTLYQPLYLRITKKVILIFYTQVECQMGEYQILTIQFAFGYFKFRVWLIREWTEMINKIKVIICM